MTEQNLKIPMTYDGNPCGHAQQRRCGLYWEIEGRCALVTREVTRAYGCRDGQSVCLGVLVPEDGQLCFRKRLAASGLPEDGFEEITVGEPAPVWRPWEGTVCGQPVSGGLSRMVAGKRWIAIPYDGGEPMEALPVARYCTPEEIGGRMYLTVEEGCWDRADDPCTGEESVVS